MKPPASERRRRRPQPPRTSRTEAPRCERRSRRAVAPARGSKPRALPASVLPPARNESTPKSTRLTQAFGRTVPSAAVTYRARKREGRRAAAGCARPPTAGRGGCPAHRRAPRGRAPSPVAATESPCTSTNSAPMNSEHAQPRGVGEQLAQTTSATTPGSREHGPQAGPTAAGGDGRRRASAASPSERQHERHGDPGPGATTLHRPLPAIGMPNDPGERRPEQRDREHARAISGAAPLGDRGNCSGVRSGRRRRRSEHLASGQHGEVRGDSARSRANGEEAEPRPASSSRRPIRAASEPDEQRRHSGGEPGDRAQLAGRRRRDVEVGRDRREDRRQDRAVPPATRRGTSASVDAGASVARDIKR